MSKRLLFITIGFICVCSNMAQTSNSHLLFQYFGANENQSELNYISWVLENNNLTTPGPDQEEAIIEAHNFYLSHKEEIDMSFKAEELIQFRSAVKNAIAAGWARALSSIASSLPTAFAAGQKQQEEYQKKINRDKEIQAYIAQHSSKSSTPKQYTQNFGSTSAMTNSTSRPQVTTSNGFEEPLPSVTNSHTSSHNNGGDQPSNSQSNLSSYITTVTNNVFNERIIQAVYVSGNQLVTCRLRYNSGRVWAYSTSKNPLGKEEWVSIQTPETPTPTMSNRDGDYAKDYKYTISGAGMKFYFNM